MKTVLILITLFASTFVNLEASGNKLFGNGIAATSSKLLYHFDAIQVEGPFQVFLTYGPIASITVEADQNLIPAISISQEDDKLFISADDRIDASANMVLYVTVQELSQMDFKNVFSVQSTNMLWANNVKLSMETLSRNVLQMTCEKMSIELRGAGNIELSGNVKDLSVANKGIGTISANDLAIETISTGNRSNPMTIQLLQKDSGNEILFIPAVINYAVRP